MVEPTVDIDVKCVNCGNRIVENEYRGTYRHVATGKECVLHKCKCGTLLAIPIQSKDECFVVKDKRKEVYIIMH